MDFIQQTIDLWEMGIGQKLCLIYMGIGALIGIVTWVTVIIGIIGGIKYGEEIGDIVTVIIITPVVVGLVSIAWGLALIITMLWSDLRNDFIIKLKDNIPVSKKKRWLRLIKHVVEIRLNEANEKLHGSISHRRWLDKHHKNTWWAVEDSQQTDRETSLLMLDINRLTSRLQKLK